MGPESMTRVRYLFSPLLFMLLLLEETESTVCLEGVGPEGANVGSVITFACFAPTLLLFGNLDQF
jgi:hypothetical protein